MNYFYYNTDAGAFGGDPRSRLPILIEGGFAAAGGDRNQYGEQLRQLAPGDILLMYSNGDGIVAVGRVKESWDGVQHKTPRYYTPGALRNLDGGPFEYRIAVDWFLDLTSAPISAERLRERFGYKATATTVTRGTIDKIEKQKDKVASLLKEIQADIPADGLDALAGELFATLDAEEAARAVR